jgi:hypothetical protein
MKQLALGFVVGLVACGGGGSGGGGAPVDEVQAESLCRTGCEKDVECDPDTTLEDCIDDCVLLFSGWARRDALETLVECGVALTCDENDDVCLSQIRPLAIHEEWEGRCRTAFAACQPPDEVQRGCEVDLADPEAGDGAFFSFIAAPIMREIIDCLDIESECVPRTECVQTILDELGIGI